MITAPFNFVPLNEKVFFPLWGEYVSHDIPFEDAQSGVIDIKITAKSPIFIKDSRNEEKFCNHNGHYYIPGSSIKGMVRNVLEIMSFSKLNDELFNDNTYAVRDLSSAKNFYMTQMSITKEPFTECGWLKIVEGKYFIEDCGIPGRVKHEEIDKIYDIDFASKFKKKEFDNKTENKTALKKYQMIKNKNYTHSFSYFKDNAGRKIYKYDKKGKDIATLVLTGQPSGRDERGDKPSGKIYEFIFFEKKNDVLLEEKVVENFKFAYFDKRDTEESPDWTYWKEKLYNGEKIPVFFQKSEDKILHFGLSYLYKLPYKYSIKDGIPNDHFDRRLDLAQTIFGTVDKKEGIALKGRVQFSHFKATHAIEPLKIRSEILGTPRASYYPIYVEQKNSEYKSYMDDDFKIAGRKRYPIHTSLPYEEKIQYNPESKVATHFQPLANEVVFEGKLRYHNLKKMELGALLSALSFHKKQDQFYHSLGMAKSLGYGSVNVEVDLSSYDKHLQEYELLMQQWAVNNLNEMWNETFQIKELFAMAYKDLNLDKKLHYMTLNPEINIDEFADAKKNNYRLEKISELKKEIQDKFSATLLSTEQITNLKKLMIEKQEEDLIRTTPDSKSEEFCNAIKKFVIKRVSLPIYDYKHLRLLLLEQEDEIKSTAIYNAYIDLTENDDFLKVEDLLIKRDKNIATDLELAKLYKLIIT